MEKWVDVLRRKRAAKKYTYEKLSELTGISERTLNNYERERRIPPADYFLQINRVLGIDSNNVEFKRG